MTMTNTTDLQAIVADPAGYVFQHDETGRTQTIANDGISTAEVYMRLNPRMHHVGNLYSEQQLRAASALSQQPKADPWEPSGADYDRSIHSNRDASAWADFFVATFPGQAAQRDLM